MTQYTCLYLIFFKESEFSGFRGFQDHPEGLSKCRDRHGHGLGQEVDNFLLSAYDILSCLRILKVAT